MSPSPSFRPSEPTSPSSTSVIVAPRAPSRRRFVIGIVAILLCLTGDVVALTMGRGLLNTSRESVTPATTTERAAITSLIDRFLRAMTQRDITTAYDLFSSRVRQQMPMTTLTELRKAQPYLYDGYQTVTLDMLDIITTAETNPVGPQGTVASVLATITYADGSSGSLRATLEQEHEAWQMFSFTVMVSSEKMKTIP
jgi:hypothetical protein